MASLMPIGTQWGDEGKGPSEAPGGPPPTLAGRPGS
jgi:hypothetical protein